MRVARKGYLPSVSSAVTEGTDASIPDNKISSKTTTRMELQEWLANPVVVRRYLTLGQVKRWDEGERYHVLCLDRNVEDLAALGEHTSPTSPEIFFKDANRMALEVAGGPRTPNAPPAITQKWIGVGNGSIGDERWEFHVEYAPSRWFPMRKGLLTGFQPTGYAGEGIFVIDRPTGGKTWEDFPDDTLIGWNGPMLLWEDLYMLPPVMGER